jgi:16S rRNA (guanine527-N7)-methyltransferase
LPFSTELNEVLPPDLPNRDEAVLKASQHLALIVEANQYLNLTRITTPREAAIKHVLDSVIPWRLFAGAKHVVDAGTGAGFPGIPLAVILPGVRFTLAESIQKKARFVESAVESLKLPNVKVAAQRAEEITKSGSVIITARAMAPLPKALDLFGTAVKSGAKLLLYKGPDTAQEIEDAAKQLQRLRLSARVVMEYELPEGMGTRTILEVTR